jgi:Protein phosphatase 2C
MADSDRPRQPRDRPGAWQVLAATERGAAHHARGLPNQDAVAHGEIGDGGAVVAVADGHGHSRHFRSAQGAQLAVAAACAVVRELIGCPPAGAQAQQVAEDFRATLVPAILARWRQEVGADFAGSPFTRAEKQLRWPGDNPVIAYGTTLLVAAACQDWLLLAQIGDGDIVGIRADGAPLLPVPRDPLLDGHHTTSLCSYGADQSFRVAAVDIPARSLVGVLLATDGYANAQAAEPWEQVVTADLAKLIGEHPRTWLAGQLPAWARRCASADGSADDTTIALLLAPRREGAPPSLEMRAP